MFDKANKINSIFITVRMQKTQKQVLGLYGFSTVKLKLK